jgi:hypothetical protein
VLGVWVTLLIVGVTLMVVLWAGTTFLQGYFYTEVSTHVFWQAPAAAAALTLFYGLWCLLDYSAPEAGPGTLPYDTLFRFSIMQYKSTKPPKEIWVLTRSKKDEKILYTLVTEADLGRTTYAYKHLMTGRNLTWPRDVTAIILKEDSQEVRYDLEQTGEGAYRRFVGPDGWVIVEYETGPAGPPERSSFGLWLVNMLLNVFHFGLWFVCLWLLLRFQWGHALGLAIPLWLVMTIVVVPVLLEQTGHAARQSRGPPRSAAAAVTAPRPAA